MNNQICIVCLRVDRPIKEINSILYHFHDELCEYGLPSQVLKYCSECEHIMKKFYKFQRQCRRALKIYTQWKATKKSKKQPISVLCSLLPPTTLGPWTASSKVAMIVIQYDLEPTLTTSAVVQLTHDVTHPVYGQNAAQEEMEIKSEKEDPKDDVDIKNFVRNVSVIDDTHHTNDNETSDIDDKPKNENISLKSGLNNFTLDEDDDDDDKIALKDDLAEIMTDEDKMMADDHEMMADDNDMTADDSELMENDDEELEIPDDVLEDDFLNDDLINTLVCNDDTDAGTSDGDDDDETNKKKDAPKNRPIDAAAVERIKSRLSYKFSNCGDILAKDGTCIDTDVILRNIPDKVLYQDLRSLYRILNRDNEKYVSVTLEEILNKMHERYKKIQKYEHIFDVQYLSTYDKKVEEFEKRKTYECYINAKHKCDICYTPFRQLKLYNNHMKTYHNDSPAIKPCAICKMRVPRGYNSSSHTHVVVYKCKMCTFITYGKTTMLEHFGKHTGQVYRCEKCDMSYNSKSGLFLHLSRIHRNVRHVCVTCGRGFTNARGLFVHSKMHPKNPSIPEDGNSDRVICEECDVTFPSQAVYEAHLNDVHKKIDTVRNNRDSDGLRCPVRRINKAPPKFILNKCRLCNTARRGGGWLKTHFKKEHPNENWNLVYADTKRHLCDVCGLGFSSVHHLRGHMTLHTGALPFPCDLCPKQFRTRLLRNEHRYRHFPPTNLCTICGKKFKTKGNLFVHLQIHNGVKPHKCEICGKSFLFSVALREHVNGVHYNIRRVRKRGAAEAQTGGRKKIKEIEAQESE